MNKSYTLKFQIEGEGGITGEAGKFQLKIINGEGEIDGEAGKNLQS